jgi:hypothetical protein
MVYYNKTQILKINIGIAMRKKSTYLETSRELVVGGNKQ